MNDINWIANNIREELRELRESKEHYEDQNELECINERIETLEDQFNELFL